MAPVSKDRVKAAFRAMKDIGITEDKTKPALKKLLKVFDKNWDAIEEENYRVLADAIFEYEENESVEREKKKSENAERMEASELAAGLDGPMPDEMMEDEPERPLKRLRLKHQGQGAPSNGQPSLSIGAGAGALKIPKPEPGEPMTESPLARNKGKQPVSSSNATASTGRTQPPARDKRAQAPSGKQKQPQMNLLIKPKDEPFTDDLVSIEPLAVVHPEPLNKEPPATPGNQGIQDGEIRGTEDGVDKGMPSTAQEDLSDRSPAKIGIAASTLGEVKIYLTCNPGFKLHMPDIEAVLKKVNENCLMSYNITDPEFCVSEVMREFCDCVVELGKVTTDAAAAEGFEGQ
ncbi:hypothetical protein RND81_04G092800 [Saponaria officinalis]|uniref:WIYLD domain-containing protein n=1 Tax=Saponaria officinalis TaxID=3572 RepID=A0AAW1LDD2_SAPOF